MSSVPVGRPSIGATRKLPYVAAEQMDLDGLPAAAAQYGLDGLRLLALCRETQRLSIEHTGHDNCILPIRVAAALIGLDPNRARDCMRVHRLLTKAFFRQGWLEVVERGEGRPGGTGNVYHYVGDGPPDKRRPTL